ncbi:MAG: 2'-5' RNA ligase family protein [Acidobacteriaceae bacterium]|nr:2'-5' RNA ligase family protein [Acidobacteriaceae bacterium]
MTSPAPLILTLRLDPASAEYFNDLRQQHYPQTLNFLSAHVTLFHHSPGSEVHTIAATLEQVASSCELINIRVHSLRSLGRGVAYNLQSPQLSTLRRDLVQGWSQWLTPQDRQPFKPHITIQNKVHSDEARRTLAILSAVFTPHTISGIGLDLWRYLGGPWEHHREFLF